MHKGKRDKSALCCLPSGPGQCNELAGISKGDLVKVSSCFRPLQNKATCARLKQNNPIYVQQCHTHNITFLMNMSFLHVQQSKLTNAGSAFSRLQPFKRSQCWARITGLTTVTSATNQTWLTNTIWNECSRFLLDPLIFTGKQIGLLWVCSLAQVQKSLKGFQLVFDPGLLQIYPQAAVRPVISHLFQSCFHRCTVYICYISTVCVNIKTSNLRHLQQLTPWFPFTIQWPAMKHTHTHTHIQQYTYIHKRTHTLKHLFFAKMGREEEK